MTMTAVGDLARSFVLQRQTGALKTQIDRLSREMATGRLADPAAKAGGDLVALAAIEGSLGRLRGFRANALELGQMAATMQAVLEQVSTRATGLSATLLSQAAAAQPGLGLATQQAAESLDAVLAALNTRVADRTVLAGNAVRGAAVVDGAALVAALDPVISGHDDAGAIAAAIEAWFDDPAGFRSTAYLGSAAGAGPFAIAPGEVASLPLTAADPAVREVLKGLAIGAIATRYDQATGRELAVRAGTRLAAAMPALSEASARLGLVEGRLAMAETRNQAEHAALSLARAAFLEADPYAVAGELQGTQMQLETVYAITARLSRLSLADYLR